MIDIDFLMEKADKNDPISIFEIAQLYKSCVIPSSGEEYVDWLKRFFETDIIKNILVDLEERDSNRKFEEDDSINVPEDSIKYYQYIVEAGIDLGLYYRNSSIVSEMEIAQRAFADAFIACRFDYIEVDEGDGIAIDLVSLLYELDNRIKALEGETNTNG